MKKISLIILVCLTILSCSKKEENTNINNCYAPGIAVNVSGNSVNIYINSSSGSNSYYEIEYGLTGFSHGSGTTKQSNNGSFDLTNLSKATYDIYVRANCGSSSWSDWSNAQSFIITDGASVSCQTPNNLYANTSSSTYYFSWLGNSDYYDVEFGETGFTIGTGTRIRTNNTYTSAQNMVFTTGKTYDFYVKGYCGASDYSSWSTSKSFYADNDQNVCNAPSSAYASKTSSTRIDYNFSYTTGQYEVSLSTSSSVPSSIYGVTSTSGSYTGSFGSSTTYYFYVRSVCSNGDKSAWKIVQIP